jgi:hypothetical protein
VPNELSAPMMALQLIVDVDSSAPHGMVALRILGQRVAPKILGVHARWRPS